MKNVLLIDIGAGPLPVVTPVPARQSAWFPVLHTAPPLPTPPNVRTTAVADGILVEWDAVPIDGVIYVVSRAPAQSGPYVIVHRTTGLRYLHTDNTGEPSWFRVSIELNGRESVPSVPVVETPVDVTDAIAGAGQAAADALAAALAADAKAAQEIIDRQTADAQVRIDAAQDAANKVAAEAQARADDLLNERLDWTAAVTQETTLRQDADESLSQSISLVSAGSGQQFDSKQIWRFDTTVEGWSGTTTPTIVDGWLRPANGTNVYVQSPDSLDVDGSAYRYMKLRIRKVGTPTWKGQVQWTTTTDNTFNATKSMTIPEPSFDANGIATIDFNDIGWWPATVRRVRITLGAAQAAANYYLIDWVAIGRPTPGAGVALVQEVQEALVTKDSAQSLARETLAAQLRGTYEGTDVALVTQGLVWSERQARVSAVGAEASRTDGIVARMPTGTDKLANEARVVTAENASVSRDTALGTRANAIEVRMPTGTDKLANEARVVTAENASVSRDDVLASRATVVEARLADSTTVINPSFELGEEGWGDGLDGAGAFPSSVAINEGASAAYSGNKYIRFAPDARNRIIGNKAKFSVRPNDVIRVRMQTRTSGPPTVGAQVRVGVREYIVDGSTANRYAPWITASGSAWLYPDGIIDGTVTLSADAAFASVFIYVTGLTDNYILCDAVEVIQSNALTEEIQARITSADSASVSRDTALGGRIDTVETSLSGKASSTAFNALDSYTRTTLAGEVGTNASNISGVTAKVSNISGSGANLIPVEYTRWMNNDQTPAGLASGVTAEVKNSGLAPMGGSFSALRTTTTNTTTSTRWHLGTSNDDYNVPVEAGKSYIISVYAAGTTGRIGQIAARSNSDGGYTVVATATLSASSFVRISGVFTAPAGCNAIQLLLYGNRNVAASGSLAIWTGVMVEEQVGPGTAPSTWNAGSAASSAAVTQSLTASAGPGGAYAQATVMTDVNGRIAGTKLSNNGAETSFEILADKFGVYSADGSYTVSGGITVSKKNGYMNVGGPGFGAGNEFMEWFGPAQSSLSGCTRSKAISYKTITGVSYQLGAMFSGTITNGGYRTDGGTTYTTASFTTLGGDIVVNASFSRNKREYGRPGSTGTAGSGSTTSTIQLWRKVGSGAMTLVTSRTAAGTLAISPSEAGISPFADWNNTNSITYTDTSGGTANKQFEVRVTNDAYQTVTFTGGSGSIPAPTNSASLGVLTSEG